MNTTEIKEILGKYGVAPDKALGQNFLINQGVLKKIVEAAEIQKTTEVLEIGPGLGALTRVLAREAKHVVAVEKDPLFVEILQDMFADSENVEIIHADILSLILSLTKLSFPHLNDVKAYKVVANLPYYISSPVIQKFLYGEFRPERMVLLLQKEVAQRICAKPPRMSLLAVSVQYAADPKIVAFVKRGSFWPAPKVDSAILRITPKKSVPPKKEVEEFFRVARAGFSNPRKQILGNLSTGLRVERITMEKILKDAGISFSRRAETLSVAEWASLATSCGNLSET